MAGFMLDTNVVSELVRAIPEPKVLQWVSRQVATDLCIAAVTLGELTRGVARLPDGRRRDALARWVSDSLPGRFEGRILPFDREAAVIWGNLMGTGDRTGRPWAAIDAQIAATALRHGLALATRNTADFRDRGIVLANPWDEGPSS